MSTFAGLGETLLADALQRAPRRYRMPPLPPDAEAAVKAGPLVALAFALEEARLGRDARALFTSSLAALMRAALRPGDGDASFQALVLRAQHPQVEEYARLAAQQPADRRAVRAAVDAVAHPGKLQAMPAGAQQDALAQLHRAATAGAWSELAALVAGMPAEAALQRLLRGEALLADENVRAYLGLLQRRGPVAGSDAAAETGRHSARLGEAAERDTVQVFQRIARGLNAAVQRSAYRVARSLLTPRGFPGAAPKTKDEWDVALVRATDAAADLVLLAEVKSSPAAVSSDLARLLRGLRRLAHADPHAAYDFPSADGAVRLAGTSLRALQPHARALPARVIYCCTAPPEAEPALLSAAARAVLLNEPASLAFADAILRGDSPQPRHLLPVWEALKVAPRLRAALHQYDSARAAREAMLHPEDLLQAFEAALKES
jgi:hypothetical protein